MLPCCHGGVQPTINRALAIVRIKQMSARRIEIWEQVIKGASLIKSIEKVLLKLINATYRPFGVIKHQGLEDGTLWHNLEQLYLF